MLTSTLLSFGLLQGVALAFGPGDGPLPTPAPVVPRKEVVARVPVLDQRAASVTKCNQDNCYRVMTNTPVVASSFCSTYLEATTTVTVTPTATVSGDSTITPSTTAVPTLSIPSHISAQCVLTSAPPLLVRLSSACSCLSITASGTVTVTSYAPATTTTLTAECTDLPNPYTVGGDTFNLDCGNCAYGDGPINNAGDSLGASMANCMAGCAEYEGCLGVDYAENWFGPGLACCQYLTSLAGGSYAQYDYALLSSEPFPAK